MKAGKPTPALIIAVLALVVALGGTAMAANRYVITSSSQIKPSVLSALGTQGNFERVLTKAKIVPPGKGAGFFSAKCLKGEHLISGGQSVTLAPGAYVALSVPLEKEWLVLVDATKATESSTVQVSALCAPGEVVVKTVTQ
jgi:hypothetical protein